MTITKQDLFAFIRGHVGAVIATVAADGAPQSAFMFVGVTPDLELIFYTLESNRKCQNLRRDPRLSATFGDAKAGQTLQYEGVAEEQSGLALEDSKRLYLESSPDAVDRVQWPGLVFYRVRPFWIRYSEYGRSWKVEEMRFPENAPALPVRSLWQRLRGR